ncbi:glycosyltransferase family 2 protein [Tateyamaria omphalii]|uniref:Glycosyl transferase family 2 n=1 Tax=Tateyamaria omphalii TaxID=299262 RepID=A0A1P8MUE1_9RHOB|nr:glycosyltransferase family 2 protein [Tateyamaria omphalii]APX11710.1 glycosyl transferase family 2 [Tateyamaria omphalii]
MHIHLHIGLEQVGADRLQNVLAAKRDQLIDKGVLYSRALGNKNHTRLYMAVTEAAHIDPLRYNRGYITADKQKVLHDAVGADLAKEVAQFSPDHLILSASQLGVSLVTRSELERLKALLTPVSENIRIVAHIDEPAKLLARHYAEQIMEGRGTSLAQELALAGTGTWWADALTAAPRINPQAGVFIENQAAPCWLDYAALERHWNAVFGNGALTFRAYDAEGFAAETVTDELRAAFQIDTAIGKAAKAPVPPEPSAAWLARGRQLNDLILQVLAKEKRILPRQLWRSFIGDIRVEGDPIDPASLSAISKTFADQNKAIAKAHGLPASLFKAPRAKKAWMEADPTRGFRASQYLLGFMWRIDKATQDERKTKAADLARLNGSVPAATSASSPADGLTDTARALLPPLAVQNFRKLRTSPFAPHNRLGAVNEEELAAAFAPIEPRKLPKGSTGNVIVGCMKNEAPYIVEWVAYHRAIGVDNFLIYTNGCEDGTTEILDRLQDMGIVQHRSNEDWKGNSPQQHALNQSLKEPVIKNADWIIHIDVDEFMNVRTGNGTLQDLFAAVPDATNIAMTWRLFGHNDVIRLSDDFVIDQFDRCAPKYCPKPHTVWGFKTMFKNIGAYEKISCHRPNKLKPGKKSAVRWVNGSGKDMTKEAAENGWRSSKKSIGYDLLQLNHYALRSAESFLIKRQRGRALHVDRSIGINYWIRMDWSDFRDITIKRNLPRLRAEYDTLMADATLGNWHEKGLAWHRAKAKELHANPEFQDLFDQALKVKLTETERVAYALALDMES